MVRVEIIGNQSVEQDLLDRMEEEGLDMGYSLIPNVMGSGSSGKRLGDGVWPELNFLLFSYCSKKESKALIAIVHQLKQLFPQEGLKIFLSPQAEEGE